MKKMIQVDEAWVDPERIVAVGPLQPDGGCVILFDNTETVECPVATPDDVMQKIMEATA